MVLTAQYLRSLIVITVMAIGAATASPSFAQKESVPDAPIRSLEAPSLGVTTEDIRELPEPVTKALRSPSDAEDPPETRATETRATEARATEARRAETLPAETMSTETLPKDYSLMDRQVIQRPVNAQPVSHPHQVNRHHCGAHMNCADRTGQTAGMLDRYGIKQGIGPFPNEDCNCWQCPYREPFSRYGPGEYAGPSRTQRIQEYRLRTGDQIQLMFLLTPMKSTGSYRLVVGDELMIESGADEDLTRGTIERGLKIQPDGTLTLKLIGQVQAEGQTIEDLRKLLNEAYEEFYPKPLIDVTPINTGTAARSVREAISGFGGFASQSVTQTVTPQGEIRLPRLGSIQAQSLTLSELKEEINLRYEDSVGGIEVEPSLLAQAPHYVFVLGEVAQPGRYLMDTPTTVLGSIALAGGETVGANLRQVVIFRRGENWELLSTLVDIRGAILGRKSCPRDEIWIRDGDVVILPQAPIELFNNFVQQVFTEGIYGAFPLNASYNFGQSFNN